jgi:hypothetical protein
VCMCLRPFVFLRALRRAHLAACRRCQKLTTPRYLRSIAILREVMGLVLLCSLCLWPVHVCACTHHLIVLCLPLCSSFLPYFLSFSPNSLPPSAPSPRPLSLARSPPLSFFWGELLSILLFCWHLYRFFLFFYALNSLARSILRVLPLALLSLALLSGLVLLITLFCWQDASGN